MTGFPETVGRPVLAGALPRGTTTGVGPESSCADPERLRAVTETRNVWPTSAAPSAESLSVAPSIALQPAPSVAQRSQRYVNVIGPAPVQSPGSACSVAPARAGPLIRGGLVL